MLTFDDNFSLRSAYKRKIFDSNLSLRSLLLILRFTGVLKLDIVSYLFLKEFSTSDSIKDTIIFYFCLYFGAVTYLDDFLRDFKVLGIINELVILYVFILFFD